MAIKVRLEREILILSSMEIAAHVAFQTNSALENYYLFTICSAALALIRVCVSDQFISLQRVKEVQFGS